MLNLPTELRITYDEDWNTYTDDEKADILSDYLSDTYGFCHNGFAYTEHDGYVHITDIDWDIDDEEEFKC